jgi:hypothetical protein
MFSTQKKHASSTKRVMKNEMFFINFCSLKDINPPITPKA